MSVIDRAQQEAERLFTGKFGNASFQDFTDGARFAATITAEQIEAAARELARWTYLNTEDDREYDECDDRAKGYWVSIVRLTFVAAGFEVAS